MQSLSCCARMWKQVLARVLPDSSLVDIQTEVVFEFLLQQLQASRGYARNPVEASKLC